MPPLSANYDSWEAQAHRKIKCTMALAVTCLHSDDDTRSCMSNRRGRGSYLCVHGTKNKECDRERKSALLLAHLKELCSLFVKFPIYFIFFLNKAGRLAIPSLVGLTKT